MTVGPLAFIRRHPFTARVLQTLLPTGKSAETMTSLDCAHSHWAVALLTPSPPNFWWHLQDNQALEANSKVRYCWQLSCGWGCILLSLKLGDGNELQTSGGLAKESREWLQMGRKFWQPQRVHILSLATSINSDGCLWYSVSIIGCRNNNCRKKCHFLLRRILLNLQYLPITSKSKGSSSSYKMHMCIWYVYANLLIYFHLILTLILRSKQRNIIITIFEKENWNLAE